MRRNQTLIPAEIERNLISQRTKEALRFKRAQGLSKRKPTVLNLMPPRESPALRNEPKVGAAVQNFGLGQRAHGTRRHTGYLALECLCIIYP